MLKNLIPWSLKGINPFLSTYGDKFLFSGIGKTKPIEVNPNAETTIHSAVPHRYLYAYLVAIKSLLQYHSDFAVTVHDDGSLTDADKKTIRTHIPGSTIIDRAFADKTFSERINNPFLQKVRTSYTSYLKLFDSTLFNQSERIIILDTDTLFLKRPEHIINWAISGGKPWYHMAHKGKFKNSEHKTIANYNKLQPTHIQTLIINDLKAINTELSRNYYINQGFCSGFIGYNNETINFDELDALFKLLHEKFGNKVFLWGAEQTTHGLILCSQGAKELPTDEYFVFSRLNTDMVENAVFLHFVGENRFYKLIYPELSNRIIGNLKQ